MSYATNIHVSLRNGSIDLTVTAAKLREAGGMPSGKNILLQLPSGILSCREVIVRPTTGGLYAVSCTCLQASNYKGAAKWEVSRYKPQLHVAGRRFCVRCQAPIDNQFRKKQWCIDCEQQLQAMTFTGEDALTMVVAIMPPTPPHPDFTIKAWTVPEASQACAKPKACYSIRSSKPTAKTKQTRRG